MRLPASPAEQAGKQDCERPAAGAVANTMLSGRVLTKRRPGWWGRCVQLVQYDDRAERAASAVLLLLCVRGRIWFHPAFHPADPGPGALVAGECHPRQPARA